MIENHLEDLLSEGREISEKGKVRVTALPDFRIELKFTIYKIVVLTVVLIRHVTLAAL